MLEMLDKVTPGQLGMLLTTYIFINGGAVFVKWKRNGKNGNGTTIALGMLAEDVSDLKEDMKIIKDILLTRKSKEK